jgi:SAM-dependent methyltransferase
MTRTQVAPGGYVHARSAFEDELGRLCLLQERYDTRTFGRLSALGPLDGTACLEVGAGAGSVALWLAAQAGPAGRVVATDLDPRFLAGAAAAGIEIRRHDILADPLESRRYDLVHCRALLCHLRDPAGAVRRMTAAVRPGGWLLVEDADYVSVVAADPAHPGAPRFDAIMRQLLAFIAARRSFDPFFGRRLPGLVASADLAEAGHEAVACQRQGRSPAAEVLARSLERTRDQTLSHGAVDAAEFQAVLATLRDPSFTFVDALSVAAWGRIAGLRHRAAASPPDSRNGGNQAGSAGTSPDQITTRAETHVR